MAATLKFERCTMETCGGRCCRGGGVYLEEEDIAKIKWATKNVTEVADGIDKWLGEEDGEMLLLTKDGSECVFLDSDGCSLEKMAVALKMHRWALKPLACWLFPMWEGADGSLNPPPPHGSAPEQFGVSDEDRRMRAEFYSSMPCGAGNECGKPAEEAFGPEIERWQGEGNRRSVREWLKAAKCRIGATHGEVGVFALVDMKEGEDPIPSTNRAAEMVRVDTVDVSEEMGVHRLVAGTMSGHSVRKPDGSLWTRAMDSGVMDMAFLVKEGANFEANVEWDWDAAKLRVTRDVRAGEELLLRAGSGAGKGGVDKESILAEWKEISCRLMRARHGVGVFAITMIPKGHEPLPADRSGSRWVKLLKSDYDEGAGIPAVAVDMMKDYYVEETDGMWVLTRERGMLDPALFVNGGSASEANVEWIDHDEGSRLVATRDIEPGEELLLDYVEIGKNMA